MFFRFRTASAKLCSAPLLQNPDRQTRKPKPTSKAVGAERPPRRLFRAAYLGKVWPMRKAWKEAGCADAGLAKVRPKLSPSFVTDALVPLANCQPP